MADVSVRFEVTPQKIKPFTFNELELRMIISTKDQDPYWAECVFEVPHPLSLAPDKILLSGKSLVGILQSELDKEKMIKVFATSTTYPSIYRIKSTLYLYDKDGAIAERKEYYTELECGETNAQILQNL